MPAYNVFNSRGGLVTTINVGTTTGSSFPIELIGQGISLYGPIVAQNQFFLLENFAAPLQPTAPVEGMFWYNTDRMLPSYYDGTNFIELTSATANASHGFEMLPTATDVDFTVAGSTDIYTAPATAGITYHPTGVLLIPKTVDDGGLPPITPTTFHLYIDSAEDVLENHVVVSPTLTRQAYFPINGMTRFPAAAETMKIEIVIPATGSAPIQLLYDVFVFGFQRII